MLDASVANVARPNWAAKKYYVIQIRSEQPISRKIRRRQIDICLYYPYHTHSLHQLMLEVS